LAVEKTSTIFEFATGLTLHPCNGSHGRPGPSGCRLLAAEAPAKQFGMRLYLAVVLVVAVTANYLSTTARASFDITCLPHMKLPLDNTAVMARTASRSPVVRLFAVPDTVVALTVYRIR
jgi:hypothetical protein